MTTKYDHQQKFNDLQRQQSFEKVLQQNQHTFVQMNSSEFIELVISIKKQQGMTLAAAVDWISEVFEKSGTIPDAWMQYKNDMKNISGWAPVALDVQALSIIALEMHRGGNVFSKYQVKMYGNNAHVIFKGYPGLRKHLTGTRYLASNPKIVSIGAGKLGAQNAIKGGFVVSIIISAAFHSLDQLLDDQKTWHHFVGGMAVDLTIAAASTAIAWGTVSAIVGTAAMVAVGPMIAVVVIGSVLVLGANALVDSNSLTEKIAMSLIIAENNASRNIREIKTEVRKASRFYDQDPIGFIHKLFGIPNLGGMR